MLNELWTGRVFGLYQQTRNLMGGDLPYFAHWTGGVRFDYLDTKGWRGFVALDYVGPRSQADAAGKPTGSIGGFFTADLRLEKQLDIKHSVFFEVRDLLDRQSTFYDRFPTNGRTILGGVNIRL